MQPSPETISQPPARSAFEVIDEIAAGGMGTVYRAVATSGPHKGRLVALKRLHPHLARDPVVSQMFLAEAGVVSGLKHPNVVEVLDEGVDEVGGFIALQYVPGAPLSDLMKAAAESRQLIPVSVALHIAAGIADGLHAAHELCDARGEPRHLVHRDVSPQNILVGVEGEVVLVDFGVAKVRDAVAHTRTGILKGKPAYMSPEQVQGRPIDRRTDVFALGIVLWEMLTLHRLYRGESEIDTLRKILSAPPEPVGGLRRDVPPALDRLIFDALAKDPDARVASCAELAARLREIGELRVGGPDEAARFFARVLPEKHASLTAPVEVSRTSALLFDQTRTRVSGSSSRVRRSQPVGALAVAAAIVFALASIAAGLAWRGRSSLRYSRTAVTLTVAPRAPRHKVKVSQVDASAPLPLAVPREVATADVRPAAIASPSPSAGSARSAVSSSRTTPRAVRAVPTIAPSRRGRPPRGTPSVLSRSWDDE